MAALSASAETVTATSSCIVAYGVYKHLFSLKNNALAAADIDEGGHRCSWCYAAPHFATFVVLIRVQTPTTQSTRHQSFAYLLRCQGAECIYARQARYVQQNFVASPPHYHVDPLPFLLAPHPCRVPASPLLGSGRAHQTCPEPHVHAPRVREGADGADGPWWRGRSLCKCNNGLRWFNPWSNLLCVRGGRPG